VLDTAIYFFNVLQRGIHLHYIYRIVADFTDRRNFLVFIVTGLRGGRPMKCSSIIGSSKKCCFLQILCNDFGAHLGSPIHLVLRKLSMGGKAARVCI